VSLVILCLFNGLVFGDDTDSLVVTENGNVGIGTASPQSKLEIFGDGSTVGSAAIRFNQPAGENGFSIGLGTEDNKLHIGDSWNPESGTHVTIQQDGNVGIGTTNPGYKLDIENSGAFAIELRDSSAGGTSGFIGVDSGKMFLGGTTDDNSNIVLDRSGSGNVGIGTTSPQSKLHVKGRIQQGNRFFTYAISGNTTLNTEFSHDIYTCGASQVVHIEAAITHWSAGYRATVDKIFYMDSYTTLSADTILDNGTGTAGSWSFQRMVTGNNGHGDTSDKLRITHKAGSYHGGANYYIYIKSTCPIKEM